MYILLITLLWFVPQSSVSHLWLFLIKYFFCISSVQCCLFVAINRLLFNIIFKLKVGFSKLPNDPAWCSRSSWIILLLNTFIQYCAYFISHYICFIIVRILLLITFILLFIFLIIPYIIFSTFISIPLIFIFTRMISIPITFNWLFIIIYF